METKRLPKLGAAAILLISAVILTGCMDGGDSEVEKKTLTIAGSTTVQPISIKAAEIYMGEHQNVEIIVQGGGSGTGIKMIGEGSIDIGATSRELKDSEKEDYPDLVMHEIAADGIALIVHPSNKIEDLTKQQIQDIFSGKIKNFKEVGGQDREIVVIIREEGSGTRSTFEELVMNKGETPNSEDSLQKPSNGAVKATISLKENAIGYLGLGYIDESVKALKVEEVTPSAETVMDGSYPLSRKIYLITKGEPKDAIKDFIDFIMSERGQGIVEEEGFIRVDR
ncbi:MAG: phosphate ABC transporter substrate-binding protein [Candidatus Altiarchaeota archaeon]|nr:phosphate ABC transporter substrate-binding protein [Candidatus Altiarchaeota archaeon]